MRRPLALSIALCLLAGMLLAASAGAAAPNAPQPEAGPPHLELEATGAGRANALAYSPNGQVLAVGTATGLALYDAQSRELLRFIPDAGWVRGLVFSPDGELVAASGYASDITLWRVADGVLVRRLAGHTSWVRSLAFAPDGQTLLSASDDQTLRWWRVSDGSLQRTVSEGMGGVRVVALAPDGETVAVGGQAGEVRLLNFSDGRFLRALHGHTDWIRSLAFSPDGQTLASGAFDATARLWRVSDGRPLQTLALHTFSVLAVAFSPDGQTLATGSVDSTIGLWRVADGRLLEVLTGHTGFVYSLAYAADGRTLASGAVDNTVRFWAMDPGRARTPLAAAPPMPPSAGCVDCHHLQGDFLRPASAAVAPPVFEVACAACHTEGALGLHWCPAFPRAPGATALQGTQDDLSNQVGFPRARRDFAVLLAAPGNGEHIYASPQHTLLPVSGQVIGAEAAGVEVRLEVWSGSERLAAATTTTEADGAFSFTADPRPDGSVLEVPIEKHDCVMCHTEPLAQSLILPPGAVRLVVSATGPGGQTVSDERWIRVDRSQWAAAHVTVVAEEGTPALPSLTVQATTRLYGWRGRAFTGATGAGGAARFQVEALSEAATQYVFEVPPTLVAGRLYASVAPVTLTLPAGATTMPPVTLTVGAQLGQITGQVLDQVEPVTIHAIQLPVGLRTETMPAATGVFAFAEMPLGPYLLLADPVGLAAQGRASPPLRLELAQAAPAQVSLATRPLDERTRGGVVLDDQGRSLPFAWVSAGPDGTTSAASPESGAWSLAGTEAAGARSLVATAPGYYSQAVAWPADPAAAVTFRLRPRPELQRLTWGAGGISLPPETRARVEGLHIHLEAGWLWGQGEGAQPVVVETAGVKLTLYAGRFAVEAVPGQGAWLYLFEGQAEASRAGPTDQPIHLAAPSMLALGHAGPLTAVPLDPLVIQALRPAGAAPRPVWTPTLRDQVTNRLALMGVTAAQVVTFVTYMFVLLSLFTVPLVRLVWWRRNKPHPGSFIHD